MKEKAVVLVSGGMDSCVAAAVANQEFKLCFLHINYGQRTEKKELEMFHKLADFYNVEEKLIINFEHLNKIGGSALTDNNIDVPTGLSENGVPVTYVPFRNANLLSAAVSWAEVINAKKIFIGAVAEDSAGYPDCRKEFYDAFNQVIKTGTKLGDIEIVTPIIDLNKTEIVKLGNKLNAPFEYTWSCYVNNDKACGKCDSCLRRLNAFKNAGVTDPIPYE
jgi:7-cyano-7-deazaguanine synthase